MTKENWIKWLQVRIPILMEKHNEFWLSQALDGYKDDEQSRQAAVMQSPPLDGLPENKPLYKDSGLWQMRSDDMEDVIIQQGVNESDDSFLSRCRDVHTEEMRRLLSDESGGAA